MSDRDKQRLYIQLNKARRRYNLFCLEKAVINILVVALALAITVIVIGKFLGGLSYFSLLFLLPFFIYLSIALTGLHSSWIGLTRAAYFFDKRLNLKARLITALDCARGTNPSKFSDVLIADVAKTLDDRGIKRALPHRPPKTLWILIPLIIALPLILFLLPDLHKERLLTAYKESEAHNLLDVPAYEIPPPTAELPEEDILSLKEKEKRDKKISESDLDKDKRLAQTSPSGKPGEAEGKPSTGINRQPDSGSESTRQKEARKEIEQRTSSIASLLAKLMPPQSQLQMQPPPMPMPGMPQSGSSGMAGGESRQDFSSSGQQKDAEELSGSPGTVGDTSRQESGAGGTESGTTDARPSGQGGDTPSLSPKTKSSEGKSGEQGQPSGGPGPSGSDVTDAQKSKEGEGGTAGQKDTTSKGSSTDVAKGYVSKKDGSSGQDEVEGTGTESRPKPSLAKAMDKLQMPTPSININPLSQRTPENMNKGEGSSGGGAGRGKSTAKGTPESRVSQAKGTRGTQTGESAQLHGSAGTQRGRADRQEWRSAETGGKSVTQAPGAKGEMERAGAKEGGRKALAGGRAGGLQAQAEDIAGRDSERGGKQYSSLPQTGEAGGDEGGRQTGEKLAGTGHKRGQGQTEGAPQSARQPSLGEKVASGKAAAQGGEDSSGTKGSRRSIAPLEGGGTDQSVGRQDFKKTASAGSTTKTRPGESAQRSKGHPEGGEDRNRDGEETPQKGDKGLAQAAGMGSKGVGGKEGKGTGKQPGEGNKGRTGGIGGLKSASGASGATDEAGAGKAGSSGKGQKTGDSRLAYATGSRSTHMQDKSAVENTGPGKQGSTEIGGSQGTTGTKMDAYQLRKEIRRTLRNISHDLDRLKRLASADSRQHQAGTGLGQGSLAEKRDKEGAGTGSVQEGPKKPDQEAGKEGQARGGDNTPGQEAGGTVLTLPPAGGITGSTGGNEAGTGSKLGGGEIGGSQPGRGLFSEKATEEDMGTGTGKIFELRVKGDTEDAGEGRYVESAGTEVIENEGTFKKQEPTVGVDYDVTLSPEQAEDDAIRSTHIPVEYESIIREIYTENDE